MQFFIYERSMSGRQRKKELYKIVTYSLYIYISNCRNCVHTCPLTNTFHGTSFHWCNFSRGCPAQALTGLDPIWCMKTDRLAAWDIRWWIFHMQPCFTAKSSLSPLSVCNMSPLAGPALWNCISLFTLRDAKKCLSFPSVFLFSIFEVKVIKLLLA